MGRSCSKCSDQGPERHLSGWLLWGSLYSLSAELRVSISSLRSMGGIKSIWWRGSLGAMLNEPLMTLTASFWTLWSLRMSEACFPVYHSWHP